MPTKHKIHQHHFPKSSKTNISVLKGIASPQRNITGTHRRHPKDLTLFFHDFLHFISIINQKIRIFAIQNHSNR